ncbi:hypothetical protein L9F63_012766, partial [Diploptera punctata]
TNVDNIKAFEIINGCLSETLQANATFDLYEHGMIGHAERKFFCEETYSRKQVKKDRDCDNGKLYNKVICLRKIYLQKVTPKEPTPTSISSAKTDPIIPVHVDISRFHSFHNAIIKLITIHVKLKKSFSKVRRTKEISIGYTKTFLYCLYGNLTRTSLVRYFVCYDVVSFTAVSATNVTIISCFQDCQFFLLPVIIQTGSLDFNLHDCQFFLLPRMCVFHHSEQWHDH